MTVLRALALADVSLHNGLEMTHREATRRYVRSLSPDNLLLNHRLEAGLTQINEKPHGIHGGWEAPTSMVRSHFVGNWMSTMASFWATTGDTWAKGVLDHVVGELAVCQQANGGEWLPGIPEKYLQWIKQGRAVWAPMYIVHRNMMGLFDAYVLAGNTQALEMVEAQCRWLTRFTDGMSDDELDDLLDWETGGIQELFADLYGATGKAEHLELIRRFDRRRLIEPLLKGEDPLTNMHANQSAQEIVAAARAYEVTGDERWRRAVEAYWACAVTNRGMFATGGQTFGEFWPPPQSQAPRLGKTNQEQCVVYHLSRLAEHLLRWTGEAAYADYIERNRYNGLFAQHHPVTAMVAYYLPLAAGSHKDWSTPTETFSCCLATSIQAGARHGTTSYYTDDTDLTIAQYVASAAAWTSGDVAVSITTRTYETPPEPGKADFGHDLPAHRPQAVCVDLEVKAEQGVEFALRLRLPWWLAAPARVVIDGEAIDLPYEPGTFQEVRRTWTHNHVRLELPTALRAVPLPDQPGTVAFMDGPLVLAGLVDERRTLRGDVSDPASFFEPTSELELGTWQKRWMTTGQDADIAFLPLHEVADETYTIYFPVRPV